MSGSHLAGLRGGPYPGYLGKYARWFNRGSTAVQHRFNRGSTVVQPRFKIGLLGAWNGVFWSPITMNKRSCEKRGGWNSLPLVLEWASRAVGEALRGRKPVY